MVVLMFGLIVLSFGMVSAKTMISGIIYNEDYEGVVSGANVSISCAHGEFTNVRNAVSMSDGMYSVNFSESGSDGCNDGDVVSVFAIKDGLSGSKSGVVHNDVVGTWDIAVVNVSMVPEFGAVVGVLTMLSAVGLFFVVRKD